MAHPTFNGIQSAKPTSIRVANMPDGRIVFHTYKCSEEEAVQRILEVEKRKSNSTSRV